MFAIIEFIFYNTLFQKVFDEQFFKHSFLFPDVSKESEDLQKFITSDITEKSHKYALEKSGKEEAHTWQGVANWHLAVTTLAHHCTL